MNSWVYKGDGSVQCSPTPGQSLADAKAALVKIIGAANVVGDGEKRIPPGLRSALCGLPTGRVNAFEITPKGVTLLFTGIVGPGGWMMWRDQWNGGSGSSPDTDPARGIEAKGPDVPLSLALTPQAGSTASTPAHLAMTQRLSIADKPGTIKEMIGHRLRVIGPGDAVTMDYMPSRVNMIIDENHVIQDIGFY
jgi:hypothetical protein